MSNSMIGARPHEPLWMKALKRQRYFLQDNVLAVWESISPSSCRRAYLKYRDFERRMSQGDIGDLPPWGSTVTVDGIVMRVDKRMSPFNVWKLAVGRHTRHERELVARVIKPGDVVMELGGGIGMVAIMCAKAVGSENVYSFEANPGLESLIRDNYALNDVDPTLKICILGAETGTRTFHVAELFSRSSVHDTDGKGTAIEVPVVPFNAEIEQIKPTMLIIDIQGGEDELFDYANLDGVQKLLLELHPDIIGVRKANSLRKYLRMQGFVEDARVGQCFMFLRPA